MLCPCHLPCRSALHSVTCSLTCLSRYHHWLLHLKALDSTNVTIQLMIMRHSVDNDHAHWQITSQWRAPLTDSLPFGGPWVMRTSTPAGTCFHLSRRGAPTGRLNAQPWNSGCLQSHRDSSVTTLCWHGMIRHSQWSPEQAGHSRWHNPDFKNNFPKKSLHYMGAVSS